VPPITTGGNWGFLELAQDVLEHLAKRLALSGGERFEPTKVDDQLPVRLLEWLGRATSRLPGVVRAETRDRFVHVLPYLAQAPLPSANAGFPVESARLRTTRRFCLRLLSLTERCAAG